MSAIVKLKLNKEFRRVYGRGKSYVHPALVTYVLPCRAGGFRIGITAGKKVGGAVQRNRARRLITAAYRELAPWIDMNRSAMVVFVARAKTPACKMQEVHRAMRAHFAAAGLIARQRNPQ